MARDAIIFASGFVLALAVFFLVGFVRVFKELRQELRQRLKGGIIEKVPIKEKVVAVIGHPDGSKTTIE